MCSHLYVCTCKSIHLYVCTCKSIHLYVCTCKSIHLYVCTYKIIHLYVCTCKSIHLYVCTCKSVHLYVCTCKSIHLYVCTCKSIHLYYLYIFFFLHLASCFNKEDVDSLWLRQPGLEGHQRVGCSNQYVTVASTAVFAVCLCQEGTYVIIV